MLWFTDLIDMRYITDSAQDIYVKVAASELDQNEHTRNEEKSNAKNRTRIIASTALSAGVLIAGIILVLLWRRKKRQRKGLQTFPSDSISEHQNQKEDRELPLFDFTAIVSVTNNFSTKNILGEGGFGYVYKGVLKDGQEVDVKRLSKSSKQGLNEFTNEVKHIAKLQHRNLVKLLGCCIHADEGC